MKQAEAAEKLNMALATAARLRHQKIEFLRWELQSLGGTLLWGP